MSLQKKKHGIELYFSLKSTKKGKNDAKFGFSYDARKQRKGKHFHANIIVYELMFVNP